MADFLPNGLPASWTPDQRASKLREWRDELRALRDDFLTLQREYPNSHIDWIVLGGDKLCWSLNPGESFEGKHPGGIPPVIERMRRTLQRAGRYVVSHPLDNGKADSRWVLFMICTQRRLSSFNDASGVHEHPSGHQTGTFYAAMESCAAAVETIMADAYPDEATPADNMAGVETPEGLLQTQHGIDFRSVLWFGTSYIFTAAQAACVKLLWEHWDQRTPAVGEQTILEAADATGTRLRDLFKNHPAWGALITPAGRGAFQLSEPTIS